MKKLFLILLFLSGCALMPTPFDSTLYDRIVNMSVIVDHMQEHCGIDAMLGDTEMLKNESDIVVRYTIFTSKDLHSSIVLIDKNIVELNNIYRKGTPSESYCKLKLKIIGDELHLVLIAIGGKNK